MAENVKGLSAPKRLIDDPRAQEMLDERELEQYRRAIGIGMLMLYDEKFIPKARKMIEVAPSVAAGIGDVVAMLGAHIYRKALEAGDQISANVLALAGMDLVREVAEFAEKFAGKEVSQQDIEEAFFMASDGFRAALGRQAPDLSREASVAAQAADPAEVQMMRSRAMRDRLPEKVRPGRGLGGMI